jgi:hypothetical protein
VQELSIFLDPVAMEVEAVCILCAINHAVVSGTRCGQYGKAALILFRSWDAVTQFQELYSNMQLPSYR